MWSSASSFFFISSNNLDFQAIHRRWNLMETSDVLITELWFHSEREYFSLRLFVWMSACLCAVVCPHILSFLQAVLFSSHTGCSNCTADIMRFCVHVCVFLLRGAVEPFVVRCSQDDNHPGRLIDSDQHCDHPSLWMEQLHLRWRPQAQVPLLTCAEKHYGLSEVNNLMITLDTSSPLWTFYDITPCISISLSFLIKLKWLTTDMENRLRMMYIFWRCSYNHRLSCLC